MNSDTPKYCSFWYDWREAKRTLEALRARLLTHEASQFVTLSIEALTRSASMQPEYATQHVFVPVESLERVIIAAHAMEAQTLMHQKARE